MFCRVTAVQLYMVMFCGVNSLILSLHLCVTFRVSALTY